MFDGWDLIIIGAIAIVIIMWGPTKIPEFARALGRAQGEFKKAQKEFSEEANAPEAVTATPAMGAVVTSKPAAAIKTKDEMLLETAQRLGIPYALNDSVPHGTKWLVIRFRTTSGSTWNIRRSQKKRAW